MSRELVLRWCSGSLTEAVDQSFDVASEQGAPEVDENSKFPVG